jgi:hypothetical protein
MYILPMSLCAEMGFPAPIGLLVWQWGMDNHFCIFIITEPQSRLMKDQMTQHRMDEITPPAVTQLNVVIIPVALEGFIDRADPRDHIQ